MPTSDQARIGRRDAIKYGAGTLAAGIGLAHGQRSASGGNTSPITVEDVRTITQQPDIYYGWPTLAQRSNGDLLVVSSGGREAHVCPFGRVELMRSHDGGESWTWPEVVLDGPIDDRDAGVLETNKGTLLVTTFTSLAYQPILERAIAAGKWPSERLARWKAAHERVSEEERQKALGVWMTRSTDGGLTWSQRQFCHVDSPHGPIQLSDGRLLYCGKELWHGDRRIGAAVSSDDGQTWSWLAQIPTREGDDRSQYHELHAVEASDGTIVAQIRNHNKQSQHETLQTESTDGGKTWSAPHSIGVWGYPSHLVRLRDGRLLMTYGHRRDPVGNQVRLSEDHGKTWSAPIVLYGDAPSTDMGYPSTVERPDGSFVSVWYEKPADSSNAVLRQARWRLTG